MLLFIVQKTDAQKEQNDRVIPDSIQNKSTDQLITLIKTSTATDDIVYKKALEHTVGFTITLAEIYHKIGYYFYENKESDRSLFYLERAIEIAKQNKNDKLLLHIYLTEGNTYLQAWKNQKALDSYNLLLDIATEKNDITNQIIAKSNITIVLRRMNRLDKALDDCKGLLKLINQTSFKNTRNHVNVITILSEIYLDLEKYDSVLSYADRGIAMSKELSHQLGIADLYIKQGIVHYKKNNTDKALAYFYDAEEILIHENFSKRSNQYININYFLATYFYDIKSYEKAISYLLRTVNSLEKSDLRKNRVVETRLLLANCYKEIGDTERSSHWFEQYVTLRDTFQKNKDQTIDKIFKEDAQRFDNKIKDLETQRKKEETRNTYGFIFLIITSLVLVLIILFYYKKHRDNRKLFTDLVKKISLLESKEFIENTKPKSHSKEIVIDDNKSEKIRKGLDKLEQQEYYLNSDCTLRSMAKKIKTNATYLSKIIKTHKKKSFNDYINDLRIEYALKRLKNDKKFRSFSIKSIALEIGYKSDNSFTKHFKLKTGLNPSYYIKNTAKLEGNKE